MMAKGWKHLRTTNRRDTLIETNFLKNSVYENSKSKKHFAP
jgi:hypothetical protein